MKKLVFFSITAFLALSVFSQQTTRKVLRPEPKSAYATIDFDAKPAINTERHNAQTRGTEGPQALYSFPDGYFYVGLTYDNIAISDSEPYMLAPAFYPNNPWKNLSVNAETYEWVFTDADNPSEATIKTTEATPTMVYPHGRYYAPVLIAHAEDMPSTIYFHGNLNQVEDYQYSIIQYGGNADIEGYYDDIFRYGVTNLDHFNFLLGTTSISATEYAFGTNNREITSVCELFAKPSHPYVLDVVRVGASVCSAPAGWKFNLIIHRMKDGKPADVIATAVCGIEDVYSDGTDPINTLFFDDFIIDTPDGELILSELVIEDEILIELTNYMGNPNVKLAVVDQKFVSLDDKCTAYVMRDIVEGGEVVRRDLYRSDEAIKLGEERLKTSLQFTLDLTYSFLVAEDTEFNAPKGGGSKDFAVYSFYKPTAVDEFGEYDVLEFDCPDWVTTNMVYNDQDLMTTVTFTVDPLPDGITERAYTVKATIPGSSLDFQITQNEAGSNMKNETNQLVKVINSDNLLTLTYPASFTELAICNVSGQQVSHYTLPACGTFDIPTDNLLKGMYIIKLSGENSIESIKVLF